MRIEKSGYSISGILGMLERKELIVNKDYQRGTGFWPKNAMVYLIDTILNDFPVPKLYFYETVNIETRRTKMEIIDGQQRVSVIKAFANNEFRLTNFSENFEGLNFEDLEDDQKRQFLGYPLQVDVVLQASPDEVLEMFRRMNSHTTPLNKQEQRHAEYNGEFKWFINRLADEYGKFFVAMKVLNKKQVIRMSDGELLTELTMLISEGITTRSQPKMNKIYKDHDKRFDTADVLQRKLTTTLDFISENFSELSGSFVFKSYAFYSLVAALMHNNDMITASMRPGFPNSTGQFVSSVGDALRGLKILAEAHEQRDTEGEFGDYVLAAIETTHNSTNRTTRAEWMLKALNGEIRHG